MVSSGDRRVSGKHKFKRWVGSPGTAMAPSTSSPPSFNRSLLSGIHSTCHAYQILTPFYDRLQVREGEGPTDLALYHADSRLPSGLDPHCQVVRTSLAEELASGRYTTAVVRRLYKPLSPTKGALVKEFAALNAGKVAPIEPACSVLMANASGHATTAYERLACSEFVAMMLHLVGLVEPTDIPGEFMAIAPKGRVCGPPLGIKLDKPTVLSSDPVSPAHGSAKSSSSREPSLSPRSSAGSISGSHSPLPLVGSPRAVAAPP